MLGVLHELIEKTGPSALNKIAILQVQAIVIGCASAAAGDCL
jgi:hypothetical protein